MSNRRSGDRLWLIDAFAMVLPILLGAAGEALGYDRMLKINTGKRRVHSSFRQGCTLYGLIPTMPAFVTPGWPMRVLRSIVQISALSVVRAGYQLGLNDAFAPRLVGHEHSRHILQSLQQLENRSKLLSGRRDIMAGWFHKRSGFHLTGRI